MVWSRRLLSIPAVDISSEQRQQKRCATPDLLKRCQDFVSALLEIEEPSKLSVKERPALERTDTVLGQVLGRP
jgi:hypothetical protein